MIYNRKLMSTYTNFRKWYNDDPQEPVSGQIDIKKAQRQSQGRYRCSQMRQVVPPVQTIPESSEGIRRG